MGEVYRARDSRLGREVAIKFLSGASPSDPERIKRFEREARMVGMLNHANIVSIYDIGFHEGLPYIVTELLEGGTLREALDMCDRGSTIAAPTAADWARQVARGLAAAHDKGITHRDLKPENIFITDQGSVKILDFGLAKLDTRLQAVSGFTTGGTEEGSVLGTVGYMAPEQVKGQAADARSDVFSFGVVLYEMLSGRRAFNAETKVETMALIVRSDPPTVELPAEFQPILGRCLEKDPKDRYQSARELESALQAIAPPERPRSSVSTIITQASIDAVRGPLPWVMSIAAVLVMLAAGGWFGYRWWHARQSAKSTVVLVGDFENSTGDALFDQSLRELVSASLGQSHVVMVYPPMRVAEALRRAEKPPRSPIGETLGLEICKREGLQALVLGAIGRLGSSYLLAVRAVGANGKTLMSNQTQVQQPDEVPPALDTMVRELRQKLGELPAEMKETSAPLAQVTTGSLEAISDFTIGKDYLAAGRFDDARAQFQKALQLDPKFAMAQAYVGLSYSIRDRERGKQNLYQATQMLSKVTGKERLKILGDYSLFAGDTDAAIGYYQALSELTPLDPAPLLNLSTSYLDRGDVALGQEAMRKAAAMAPSFVPIRINLVRFALYSGDSNAAYSMITELRKIVPDSTAGSNVLGYYSDVLVSLGKFQEARTLMDEMIHAGGEKEAFGRAARADLDLAQGRYEEGRAELRTGIAAAEKIGNDYLAFKNKILLAEIDPPAAKALTAGNVTGHDPAMLFLLGKWYATSGHQIEAGKILDALSALAEKNSDAKLQSFRSMVQAEIDLADGKQTEAATAAEQALRDQNSTWALEVLGDIYTSVGRDKDAARAYAQVLARGNERAWLPEDPAYYRLATLHYRAGVAYQKVGDPVHAREQLKAFLDLGSGADAGLPMYQDARARLKSIGP